MLTQTLHKRLSQLTESTLIHDPYGMGYQERALLPPEFQAVWFPDDLMGRKNYEACREHPKPVVFLQDRHAPVDLLQRFGEPVSFQLSTLLGCHPVLDQMFHKEDERCLEIQKDLGQLAGKTDRGDVLKTYTALYYHLPSDQNQLLQRLENIHEDSHEGLHPTRELKEGLLMLLSFLTDWDAQSEQIEAEHFLTPQGLEHVKSRLFQLSLKANSGQVKAHPQLLKWAEVNQSTGGTRIKAGVYSQVKLVAPEEWLAQLKQAKNIQLERAYLETITEKALLHLSPTEDLKKAIQHVSRQKRKYRELEEAQAALKFLQIQKIPVPSLDGAPQEWLDLGERRAQLDLAFARLPKMQRQKLQEHMFNLTRQWDYAFGRYITQEYPKWMRGTPRAVPTSADIVQQVLTPADTETYLLVFDGMALDQWYAIEDMVRKAYPSATHPQVIRYCSLLPSATPYARNALFSGMTPAEMARTFGAQVLEGNEHEDRMLKHRIPEAEYMKVADKRTPDMDRERKRIVKSRAPFKAFVFNTIDNLIHAKHLGDDREKARNIIRVEFNDSPMLDIIEEAYKQQATVLITSDHGNQLTYSKTYFRPDGYVSDYAPSARYASWTGKIPGKPSNDVYEITDANSFGLPQGTRMALCLADKRLSGGETAYLAHGGISLLECIIPMVVLRHD